jgi:hypothetical protein
MRILDVSQNVAARIGLFSRSSFHFDEGRRVAAGSISAFKWSSALESDQSPEES